MMTADGIDIKKAKLLIDGVQYGTFTNIEVSVEKPKETMTTIGGEVKHRGGTDRTSWTAETLLVVNSIKDTLALMKKSGSFVIEGETADDAGATETITLRGAQITGYRMSFSDNSVGSINGICDEPV